MKFRRGTAPVRSASVLANSTSEALAGDDRGHGMTADPGDQRTTDEEYIQRVLRYKPSSSVPWIARVGAQYSDIGSWLKLKGDYMRFNPWALADIARVSLDEDQLPTICWR